MKQTSVQTEYLVKGYIRQIHISYEIHEINELCIRFYGYYSKQLIYLNDHRQWFKSQIQNEIDMFKYTQQKHNPERVWINHRATFKNKYLQAIPITQYIDDKYQIVFGAIMDWRKVSWSGFLCIDIDTKEVHELTCAHFDNHTFHLLISDALTVRSVDIDANGDKIPVLDFFPLICSWLKPKYQQICINSDIDYDAAEEVNFKFWNHFQHNLWNLFVFGRLYDENKDIKDQQIWGVIRFLSLIYFEDKQCGHNVAQLTVPNIILDSDDIPQPYFDFWEKMDKYFNKMEEYIEFNVYSDCNGEIMEYIDGNILKCKCYLYADWGDGFWEIGGCRQHLYCVIFEIRKDDDINITIEFKGIQTLNVPGYNIT